MPETNQLGSVHDVAVAGLDFETFVAGLAEVLASRSDASIWGVVLLR